MTKVDHKSESRSRFGFIGRSNFHACKPSISFPYCYQAFQSQFQEGVKKGYWKIGKMKQKSSFKKWKYFFKPPAMKKLNPKKRDLKKDLKMGKIYKNVLK